MTALRRALLYSFVSTHPPLVTYQQAAAALGVSYATIRRYAAQNRLAVIHLSPTTRRIEQASIDALIAAGRTR